MLSERERQALARAEAFLLEHDEALVRSFDALAGNDGPHADGPPVPRAAAPEPGPARPPEPAAGPVHAPEPGPEAEPVRERAPGPRHRSPRRPAPMYDRLLRVLFVLGLVGLLAVCGWIYVEGDTQIRLLTGMVVFPVLVMTVFTVVVLNRREDR